MGVVVFDIKQPPSVMTQAEMFQDEVVFLKFSLRTLRDIWWYLDYTCGFLLFSLKI